MSKQKLHFSDNLTLYYYTFPIISAPQNYTFPMISSLITTFFL